MSAERHLLVKGLFLAALDLGPDKWSQFLDAACAQDSSLRGEVEAFLAKYEETGVVPPSGSTAPEPAEIQEAPYLGEGAALGPYKILGTLGQGGMGRVYLAVRDDEEFKKRVALKVIRPGLATREVLRRFRQERQILAALDHEHIAKLLDGGSTRDGSPYFVMEYVEGEPIDAYCDSHRLAIHERLELFRTVCAAVHFAHQNLVIHRDLKPSNILVSPKGVPKLLDFGVAKLLNPELSAESLAPTRFGMRLGTPQFASPEQIRGKPVTTATDIYSLGVLLYELLTGRSPYPVRGRSITEVERVICEHEPAFPSTRIGRGADQGEEGSATPKSLSSARNTHPERLPRLLSGDLDNIVLMALRKEPQRRYSSANQFSEDIRRHLAGLPVIARKDTVGYRAGKFVQRHRAGVASAAAFCVLLVAFAIAVGLQSARVRMERDRAEAAQLQATAEAETAREVSEFLVDLFEISEPGEARANTVTAREILERGAQKIEDELADQPLVQARLMETIGNVYRRLGLFPAAEILLEKALANRERILGPEHPEVATNLSHLGHLYRQHGRFADALPVLERSLEIRERNLGGDHPAVAEVLARLGMLHGEQGAYDKAEPLFRRALEIHERASGADHAETSASLQGLAVLYGHQGKLEEATPLFRRVLEIQERSFGTDHPKVAIALSNLGELFRLQGKHAEAEPLLLRAIEIHEDTLGGEHPILAAALQGLADLRIARGEHTAAEPVIRRVLAIREKVLGPEHPETILALESYAALLRATGREAQAAVLDRRISAAARQPP